jgi:hypothetical protein
LGRRWAGRTVRCCNRTMGSDHKTRLRDLAKSLCRLSYQEIETRIPELDLDDDSLIELINSRSRKVAGTASQVLNGRGKKARLALINAIFTSRMTHRDAKVIATNTLVFRGRECPEAVEAYLFMLDDKNEEVADNALFGIVFFQDKKYVVHLKRKRDARSKDSWLRGRLDKAIQALENQDPFIYSPNFQDGGDVWKLDKERFGDRIGLM